MNLSWGRGGGRRREMEVFKLKFMTRAWCRLAKTHKQQTNITLKCHYIASYFLQGILIRPRQQCRCSVVNSFHEMTAIKTKHFLWTRNCKGGPCPAFVSSVKKYMERSEINRLPFGAQSFKSKGNGKARQGKWKVSAGPWDIEPGFSTVQQW